MSVFLKVKLKSLMEEAKIIRKEELRARNLATMASLHRHRTVEVRNEARATHLAYGLLRGKTRHEVEVASSSTPDIPKIIHMVKRYGPMSGEAAKVLVEEWLAGP